MSNKAIDLAATPRTEFGKGAARRARRKTTRRTQAPQAATPQAARLSPITRPLRRETQGQKKEH